MNRKKMAIVGIISLVTFAAGLCIAGSVGTFDATFTLNKQTAIATFNDPKNVGLEGFDNAPADGTTLKLDCSKAACNGYLATTVGYFGKCGVYAGFPTGCAVGGWVFSLKQGGLVNRNGNWMMRYNGVYTGGVYHTPGSDGNPGTSEQVSAQVETYWIPGTGFNQNISTGSGYLNSWASYY